MPHPRRDWGIPVSCPMVNDLAGNLWLNSDGTWAEQKRAPNK